MGVDNEEQMRSLGFEELQQDPSVCQLTFFGTGGPKSGEHGDTAPGDAVEVFRDDASGRGAWQGGLVALSPVVPGSTDGPYNGEDVVWVGWAADYKKAQSANEKPKGDEWPADMVRVVPAAPKGSFSQLGAPLHIEYTDGVVRFAYNPEEARDTHGEWTEGGGSLGTQNAAQGSGQPNPPNQPGYQGAAYGPHVTPIAPAAGAEVQRAIDFVGASSKVQGNYAATPEGTVLRLEAGAEVEYAKAVARKDTSWTGEGQSVSNDRRWYYHANALARSFAHRFNFDNSTAAGVIAAYSPQSAWIFPEQETVGPSPTSAKKAQSQDVRLAENTLDQIANHENDKVQITQEMLDIWKNGVQMPVWKKGPDGKDMKPSGYEDGDPFDKNDPNIDHYKYPGLLPWGDGAYVGAEQEFQGWTPHIGTYAEKDLPVDYLVDVWRAQRSVRGMHDMMANAAMIARGHSVDELLRGCKTRSFYNDIVDPQHVQDATIDVHMLRALTQNEALDSQKSGALGTAPGGYALANEALQRGAALHGLRPHEYQAIIWEEWRKENPPAKRGNLVKTGQATGRNARKMDSAASVGHAMRQGMDQNQAQMSGSLVWFHAGADDGWNDARGDATQPDNPSQGTLDNADYEDASKLGDTLDIYDVRNGEPDWDDPDYQQGQIALAGALDNLGGRK